jgi:hypothetical protein
MNTPSPSIKYTFTATPWQYKPPGGWHFVSLPRKISDEIRNNFGREEEGWGRLKATAKTGNSEWTTAIWYDTKSNAYLLPLKAEIRNKEKILAGRRIKIAVWI